MSVAVSVSVPNGAGPAVYQLLLKFLVSASIESSILQALWPPKGNAS